MQHYISRLMPIAALMLLTVAAVAQGPRGFGGPPPGGFGGPPPSPEMQAKFQAWRTWLDTHPNVTSLQRTLGALADIEQDPRTRLTKPQAKAVLAVIRQWQAKPALTEAQARLVRTQLTKPLNPAQMAQIATASQGRWGGGGGGPRPGGFGGPPPGGGRGFGGPGGGGHGFGGPGGGGRGFGGPGGGRPPLDPASFPAPRDYNPLNPSTQPMARARERDQQRHAQLMAALTAAAK